MSFAHPLWLWGLLLVPLVAVTLALDGQRRRRALQRVGHLPQIARMTASVSVARRRAKGVLLVLALALLVVAVARPQRPGAAHLLPQRGLDLVVALDFSRSMLAADVYPTRLDRARAELGRLLDELKGDRVGLVAFAGVTLSYPLTTDYAAAKLFWRDLTPADIPVGGTNLAEAIRAGLELLRDGREHTQRPDGHRPAQVMVLLTDGADTEGKALAAAQEAAKQGVRLYTVGMGTREGDLVLLKRNADGTAEYVSDGAGSPVRMQLDDKTLRALAEATGGDYYAFDAGRSGIDQVQKAIARLERVEEEARLVREPNELCGGFVGAALLLLLIEALLGERRRVASSTEGETATKGETVTKGAGGLRSLAVLVVLLPLLGGWSWFQRPGPDVAAGNRKLAAGHADEALADYERALGKRPDDPTLHYDRGVALYALGRYPEAQREFQRAAESTAPSVDSGLRADAYYNAGNALLQQKQAQPAIDAYKRSLRLRPDDRRAKWNLELALRQLEQQQKQQNDQQQNQDQKQQNQDAQKQQSQQDQKQRDPQKSDQQKQDQAKQDQQDQDEKDKQQQQEKQAQDQQTQDQAQKDQDKKDQPAPQKNEEGTSPQGQSTSEKPQRAENEGEKAGQPGDAASENREKNKGDIRRQDAEAVLDAFERVEPTVQKDLARRKAAHRRPPKEDW